MASDWLATVLSANEKPGLKPNVVDDLLIAEAPTLQDLFQEHYSIFFFFFFLNTFFAIFQEHKHIFQENHRKKM